MKREIAEAWAANLRSGEYIQGGGCLSDYSGGVITHCCLGVLMDMAVEEGIATKKMPSLGYNAVYTSNYSEEYRESAGILSLREERTGTLTETVREWAGMFSPSGAVRDGVIVGKDGYTYRGLANANDNGVSFAEIADFIEKNYQNL